MNHVKHGLKVLGLCLPVALGLMAVTAAGAQAAPDWTIGGKKITALRLLLGFLLKKFLDLKRGIHTHCSGHYHETIHPGGSGDGEVDYYDCYETDSKGKKLPTCKVAPFTFKFKDKLVEHAGEAYRVYEPASGGSFGTISVSGEECPIPFTESISGAFAALMSSTELVTQPMEPVSEKTELLLESALKISLGVFLGKEPATVSGEGKATLTGEDEGKVWGAK